ncbi:Uncharacterized protein HZ326_24182 [Fusarium oxysporum f. sp. albedinis]|nr:Uncharacterized protein HZ326_24182 [Fusarium oxysporum f. sp. albedinis]
MHMMIEASSEKMTAAASKKGIARGSPIFPPPQTEASIFNLSSVAYASTQIVTRMHHKSQSGVTDLLQVRQVSYHSFVSSNIMRTRKDEDDERPVMK